MKNPNNHNKIMADANWPQLAGNSFEAKSNQVSPLVIYAIAMIVVSAFLFVNYPFEGIVVALTVGTIFSMG